MPVHAQGAGMHRPTRRGFLRGAATVPAVGLTGCLSGGSGQAADGTRLDTYDVGGSPGSALPVLPPGEPALLDFWATWCAPCKPQMAELRRVREAFPGLHMLSITNEDEPAAIRAFWREYGGTWPVASDPSLETNERFGVNRIPTLLVFDAAGNEVWRHVGLAAAETVIDRVEESRG